jgi:soluble lytic murein transglycosylase-like protein
MAGRLKKRLVEVGAFAYTIDNLRERKRSKGLLTVRTLLIATTLWFAAIGGYAQGPSAPAAMAGNTAEAHKYQGLPDSHRRSIERRDQRSGRWQAAPMGKFVDDQGNITITNRTDKYRSHPEYTEVRIDFEPIAIPLEYQALATPQRYTGSSIDSLITSYAQRYRLDESLVYAVIRVESNFRADAVSPAGASGLMQLMPATAAEMGVTDIFDPAQNIAGGTQYLSKMLGLFGNNLSLALAGYNAGPGAVRQHNGIPPYKETQNYVREVLRHQRLYKSGGAYARGRDTQRVSVAAAPTKPAPTIDKPYMVHFHSGLKQPADQVLDEEPYYFIVFEKRTYPVRKELVARIDEPA